MKKIFALLLCVFVVFSFAACNKKDTSSEPEGPDVEYYAKAGLIPECDRGLSANVSEIEAELDAAAQTDPENTFFNTFEAGGYTVLSNGNYNFCYTSGKAEEGLKKIVSFDTAYGFDIGDIVIEVKEAMSARGVETAERDLTKEEVFFLPGSVQRTGLEYEFGSNSVLFVFEENALCATVLSANR